MMAYKNAPFGGVFIANDVDRFLGSHVALRAQCEQSFASQIFQAPEADIPSLPLFFY